MRMVFSDFTRPLRCTTGVLCGGILACVVLLAVVRVSSADILGDLKERQAKVTTIRARFTQEKQTRLLTKPIRSSGIFLFRQPDKIRWEYSGKVNMLVVYNGKELLIYYPDLGEADIMRGVPQYASLMHFDISRMSREYDIQTSRQKDMTRLKFFPKTKGPVALIEMEFPEAVPFPRSLMLTDTKGDVTRISFRDVLLNQEVSDSLFTFVPDSSVKVRERSIP